MFLKYLTKERKGTIFFWRYIISGSFVTTAGFEKNDDP